MKRFLLVSLFISLLAPFVLAGLYYYDPVDFLGTAGGIDYYEIDWNYTPVVRNAASFSIVPTNAVPAGLLIDNGGVDTSVTIYWGLSDAGTTKNSWQYTNSLGVKPEGSFSNFVSGLLFGQRYYYRCYATNVFGDDWADATTNFVTTMAAFYPGVWLTGSHGGDGYGTGMKALTNGSGIAKADPYSPSTWTLSTSSYTDEWMASSLITNGIVTPGLNGKCAWACLDLGSTVSLGQLWLYNISYGGGIPGTKAYNVYYATSPSVALPATPNNATYATTGLTPQGDYNFSGSGWTKFNASTLTVASVTITNVDITGISARYVAVEIFTNWGDTYDYNRVGFNEIAMTGSRAVGGGVLNTRVTNVLNTTATIVGTLYATQAIYHVKAYWDTVDRGTNEANWSYTNTFGWYTNVSGLVITNALSGLSASTPYYYAFHGSNAAVEIWDRTSGVFSTFQTLTIAFTNYTKLRETLTNFPALLTLTNNMDGSSFSYSQMLTTNGSDLRFWNKERTTQLNHEIEGWNTSGVSYVWVQVPAFTNHQSIVMNWGNPYDTNQLAYTTNGSTWSSEFAAVWHMNQASGSVLDSTANTNHGTRVLSLAQTNGAVGYALQFTNGPYLNFGNGASLNLTNAITASLWFKANAVQNQTLLNKGVSGTNQWSFQIHSSDGSKHTIGTTAALLYYGNPLDGSWYHTAGAWDKSKASGSIDVYGLGVTYYVAATTNSTPVANTNVWSGLEAWGGKVNGALDEIRIENVKRSSNWIWSCFMSQASNDFMTVFK